MRAVARDSSFTPATFYNYFPRLFSTCLWIQPRGSQLRKMHHLRIAASVFDLLHELLTGVEGLGLNTIAAKRKVLTQIPLPTGQGGPRQRAGWRYKMNDPISSSDFEFGSVSTPELRAAARSDSWPEVARFLREHRRNGRISHKH